MDQTEKRPYAQPKIIRVKLERQQAVLSLCSTTVTAASGGGMRCITEVGFQCRKGASGGKTRDDQDTS